MKALEADGIEKGFSIVAAKKPAVASKLWTLSQVTAFLNAMPYNAMRRSGFSFDGRQVSLGASETS